VSSVQLSAPESATQDTLFTSAPAASEYFKVKEPDCASQDSPSPDIKRFEKLNSTFAPSAEVLARTPETLSREISCLVLRLLRTFIASGARRMAEAAIHLVDELLPLVPVRQFVVIFPVQLRPWMARSKSLRAKVCEKDCAALTAHVQHAAIIEKGLSGLVVIIQRLGSGANLNIHFHVIALNGVYETKSAGRLKIISGVPALKLTTEI
jgi:hypothetical protein